MAGGDKPVLVQGVILTDEAGPDKLSAVLFQGGCIQGSWNGKERFLLTFHPVPSLLLWHLPVHHQQPPVANVIISFGRLQVP